MFLSDSSGSGRGFHAQIASLSKHSADQSVSRKHRKKGSPRRHKSKRRKYTGFTRVSSYKPIREASTTPSANQKRASKKTPSNRLLTSTTTTPRKDISKPIESRENSILTTDDKASIIDIDNTDSNNTATSRSNHKPQTRTQPHPSSKELGETLNTGHLKISMEIIDFTKNTSYPHNNNNNSNNSNNNSNNSTESLT